MDSKNHEILQACSSLKVDEFRLLNHVKRISITYVMNFTNSVSPSELCLFPASWAQFKMA